MSTTPYELSQEERRELWNRAEDVVRGGPAEATADKLPEGLREVVRAFGRDSGRTGFLLLRGLEVGQLPPTHSAGEPATLPGHGTAGSAMLLADALGTMIGYADEKGGELVHDVQPLPGEEDRVEGSGAVAFDFHVENVHHPLRPDFIGLVCLRQDHDGVAATRIASCREAVELLEPAEVDALRQRQFYSNYPGSFTRNTTTEPPPAGPHPVLFGSAGTPFMRFNSHNTISMSKAGRAALRALTEALESVCHDVVLRPGDCAILDNNVAAHGRSAFAPRYDGHDRWLRRFYSIKSIPSSVTQMMAGSRVVPPIPAISGIW
ncbi:TauD/TfdA family dioxygenase [Saccharothrix algeriensis]|uniref:L-asparagine oxygenase n=1 Tax=Saccharothrix algeriensis TaxID=173560 RepID=A0A8T8I0Y8_9PSEU|nr:TauD/TfdA family dioxygenase [Saccharothrix algeriensis]MBM7810450.1 L-asparagine oxygenase [Saccharothrix algeriensis]QTR04573.1 TauD/TfdA family dioxygenase [Saccharothrix algeriensis]